MYPSYKELLKKKLKSNLYDSNKNIQQEKSVLVHTSTPSFFNREESKFSLNNFDLQTQDLGVRKVKPWIWEKNTDPFEKKNNSRPTVYVSIVSPGNGSTSIGQLLLPSKKPLIIPNEKNETIINLISSTKTTSSFFSSTVSNLTESFSYSKIQADFSNSENIHNHKNKTIIDSFVHQNFKNTCIDFFQKTYNISSEMGPKTEFLFVVALMLVILLLIKLLFCSCYLLKHFFCYGKNQNKKFKYEQNFEEKYIRSFKENNKIRKKSTVQNELSNGDGEEFSVHIQMSDGENLIDDEKSKNELIQKIEKSDSTRTLYVN